MKKKTVWHLCLQLTCFTLASDAYALPQGFRVASGDVAFQRIDANSMEIRPSDQAIINYMNFDIGAQEKVRFVQKSSSSCVLNRVKGSTPSQIFGSLESNGKVFLVNESGIYFGPKSQVNVGSLIASTLEIADKDFLKGNYHFFLSKASEIRSEGTLTSLEGSIVLMASKIQNLGSIEARTGTVLLTSGEHVTLDFVGDGLIQFSVEGSLKEALIEHLGEIKGSTVALKLSTAKKAIQEIVNLDGKQEGDVFIEENGIIKFAPTATITAHSTLLEASQLSVEGNIRAEEIHLFGKDIVLKGAEIDASTLSGGGKILIGGEFQGKGTTPYASTVFMDEHSKIAANALGSGDGGLVVLWSKDSTVFDGSIEAKGGPIAGHGGQIETSSQGQLGTMKGRVSAFAPHGKIGEWLLDPFALFISSSGSNSCTLSSNTWGDCSSSVSSCSVNVSSINTSMANLTFQATSQVALDADISMANSNVGITMGGCPTEFVTLNGNIETQSGAVTLTASNMVQIQDGVTIDTTISGSGANVSCLNASSVDGSVIVINAGTGTVTFGTTGTYDGDITIGSSNQIITPSIQGNGNLSLTATNGIRVSGSTTNLSGDGTINIQAAIDAQDSSSYSLNITNSSSSGTTTLSGAIGGVNPLGSVSISSTGTAAFSSITTLTNGAITISAPATLNATDTAITSNGGAVTFTSAVNSSSSSAVLTINAGAGVVTIGGALGSPTLFGTVSIPSASSVQLGADISTTNLISIVPDIVLTASSIMQATAGNITLAGVSSTTSQSLSCSAPSGTITLGALSSLGAVTLTGNTINLNGAITSTASLTVQNTGTLTINTGSVTLSGAFNQSGGGSTLLGEDITAVTISFTNAITLAETVALTTNGSLTLGSNVNAQTSAVQGLTLAAGGAVTLGGSVGATPLNSFTISSGSSVFLSNITTSGGAISITPSVTLNGAATIATSNQPITFSSTISGAFTLTLNAGSGSISVGAITDTESMSMTGGAITLNGAVTTTNLNVGLTIIDTTSLSISAGDIDITGDFVESGGGAVSLGNSITANSIAFADAIALSATATLTAVEDLTLSQDLSATGTPGLSLISSVGEISVQDLATAGAPLGSVSIIANGSSRIGDIYATGNIDIAAPIILSVNPTTVIEIVGGGVSINFVKFESTVDASTIGNFALTVTGGSNYVVFGGDVGAGAALGAVTVSGSQLQLGGVIDTSGGAIDITAPILLTAASTLDTTKSSVGADIAIPTVTASGAYGLTLIGAAVTLGGAVTANSLSIDNSGLLTISSGNITLTSSFDQTGTGNTSLGNSITVSAGPLFFTTGITLTQNATLTSSGTLTLSKQIVGAFDLVLESTGDIVTAKNLGTSGSPLANLTMTAYTNYSKFTGIAATGIIDVAASIQLGTNATTTVQIIGGGLSSNYVRFQRSVDAAASGSEALTITAGNNYVVLDGDIGSVYPLSAVNITGLDLQLGASIYTNAGAIDFTLPILLTAASTLDTTGHGDFPLGANITLSGAINGAQSLSLDAGSTGVVTLSTAVGASTALSSFSIITASLVNIENVTATASINIAPSIILSNATTTFTSNGSIVLGNIDGTTAGSQSLDVVTTGAVTLGVIGNSVCLNDVTAATASSATISSILVSGQIDIPVPIILAASSTLDTTGNGSSGSTITLQTLNGTTVGGESLTLVAGTGDAIFEGNVGATPGNPIGSLSISGNSITFEGSQVITKGSQSYNSPVLVSQNIGFVALGDITFVSTFGPLSGTPAVALYPGDGALTFTGAVTGFKAVAVYNAGSFLAHDVTAGALVVSGGLPTILIEGTVTLSTPGAFFLDGGSIYLGGQVDAKLVWLNAQGNISNLGSPQPINVTGGNALTFEFLNATGGVVGSLDSPIEINSAYPIIVGASPRADFSGTPMHSRVIEYPPNPPCIVTFNGIVIEDCNLTGSKNAQKVFSFLPKYLFYVPGLFSSWNNLSSWEYFSQEPWKIADNPKDKKTLHWIPETRPISRVEEVTIQVIVQDPASAQQPAPVGQVPMPIHIDTIVLPETTRNPQKEPADWEFSVYFEEEARSLDLRHE